MLVLNELFIYKIDHVGKPVSQIHSTPSTCAKRNVNRRIYLRWRIILSQMYNTSKINYIYINSRRAMFLLGVY